MLGADSLNLALMVADSGLIDNAVHDILHQSELFLVSDRSNIKSGVKKHLNKWRNSVRHRLLNEKQGDWLAEELSLYQETIYFSETDFFSHLHCTVEKITPDSSFYITAHRLSRETYSSSTVFAHSFCQQWLRVFKERCGRTLE